MRKEKRERERGREIRKGMKEEMKEKYRGKIHKNLHRNQSPLDPGVSTDIGGNFTHEIPRGATAAHDLQS